MSRGIFVTYLYIYVKKRLKKIFYLKLCSIFEESIRHNNSKHNQNERAS